MKGLLMKDLLLLKNQKRSIFMILFLGIALSLSMETSAVIAYSMMMGLMLALGTFSYDEVDNGYSYLFTLPVSRRTYVREKYAFLTVWVMICSAAGILLYALLGLSGVGKQGFSWQSALELFIPMLSMIFLMMAVTVPLRIKYGSEKGRFALYIIFGIVMLAAVLVSKTQIIAPDGLRDVINRLETLGPVKAAAVMLAGCAAILAASERISQRIIAGKEY